MARIVIHPAEGEEELGPALRERVRSAVGRGHEVEVARPRRPGRERRRHTALLGESAAARALEARVAELCQSDEHVLIVGEPGAGKARLARAIHERSPRADGEFVVVHLSALTTNLMEAEIFGHAAGAFTGAVTARLGTIEEADGGTLYLDAVDHLPTELAERLATLMASGVYWPVGATEGRTVDVRVVCAMDRDDAECSDALPHPDLAERLCNRAVRVPPLRERPEDIKLMAAHLLAQVGARSGQEAVLTDAANGALMRHDFPGNLLELENIIEHAVLAADQPEIDALHLPLTQRGVEPLPAIGPSLDGACPGIAAQAREIERDLLGRARRERPELDTSELADLLGTTERVIELRLQEYGWEE